MSRRDLYHDAVRRALEKDGWLITHDPLVLAYGRRDLYVDLGAEAPMAAERAGRKIAVEVKSFLSPSPMVDLERALGQYVLYGFLIGRREPDRLLYLAVSREAMESVFDEPAGRDLVAERQIRLIVFEPSEEVIVRWIEPTTDGSCER
jgi:hypothetical protein